ncbi:hypothetical protein GA0070610_1066 [Micromonospora echinofusca]|uniref:Uncharacterized protein n=1 Tax=Micromonospora echinofusca TaxID=47858 RepID=A0A1C5G4Y8_MICEH|nr:hypothetical protein [Micromonospora echinofusca]SCG14847.1 hypothetical protein GA0070610_1066 [Micromonospora echinofusca]
MAVLDLLTLERVARLICDADGPYERTGSQVERFLHRVRWPGSPQYDGSPRVPWLTEVLTSHADDAAALDRLLCRICDPLEYDGGIEAAEPIAQELNRILAPEGLTVTYVGGRPVLGQLSRTGDTPLYGPPPDLHERVRRLSGDSKAVDILMARADEASICQNNGAYALAIIGIGSFVEGLLHVVVTDRDETVRRSGLVGRGGRRVPAERAGLHLLLEYAHRQKWVQTDAKDFMEKVRDYRNFVHPRHQIEYGLVPDLDTVRMCWAPVHALLNDLESAP